MEQDASRATTSWLQQWTSHQLRGLFIRALAAEWPETISDLGTMSIGWERIGSFSSAPPRKRELLFRWALRWSLKEGWWVLEHAARALHRYALSPERGIFVAWTDGVPFAYYAGDSEVVAIRWDPGPVALHPRLEDGVTVVEGPRSYVEKKISEVLTNYLDEMAGSDSKAQEQPKTRKRDDRTTIDRMRWVVRRMQGMSWSVIANLEPAHSRPHRTAVQHSVEQLTKDLNLVISPGLAIELEW